jgi:hypothetical protein
MILRLATHKLLIPLLLANLANVDNLLYVYVRTPASARARTCRRLARLATLASALFGAGLRLANLLFLGWQGWQISLLIMRLSPGTGHHAMVQQAGHKPFVEFFCSA